MKKRFCDFCGSDTSELDRILVRLSYVEDNHIYNPELDICFDCFGRIERAINKEMGKTLIRR